MGQVIPCDCCHSTNSVYSSKLLKYIGFTPGTNALFLFSNFNLSPDCTKILGQSCEESKVSIISSVLWVAQKNKPNIKTPIISFNFILIYRYIYLLDLFIGYILISL